MSFPSLYVCARPSVVFKHKMCSLEPWFSPTSHCSGPCTCSQGPSKPFQCSLPRPHPPVHSAVARVWCPRAPHLHETDASTLISCVTPTAPGMQRTSPSSPPSRPPGSPATTSHVHAHLSTSSWLSYPRALSSPLFCSSIFLFSPHITVFPLNHWCLPNPDL